VARMGKTRTAYNILVGKPEENTPLGRPRRRWGIGWEDVYWMHLAQDRGQ
jgi:hypothetical protein